MCLLSGSAPTFVSTFMGTVYIEGKIEGEISKSADLVQRVMANSNVSFEQACEMLSMTEKEIAVISEYMALHSS